MTDSKGIYDNENDPVPMIYDRESITFALDENDFKDFMTKLLGKPEVIQGDVIGAFEIDFNSFQNINQQIENIVCETNDAWLIEFTAILFLDDNSSIRFNRISDFISYREVRAVTCIGFNFTWVYLVKFKSEQAPQKQEISIYSDYLNLTSSNKSSKFDKLDADNNIENVPRITYSIRSTIPNWGMLVAQRIKLVLESNCLVEIGFQNINLFIRHSLKHVGQISPLLIVTFLVGSIFWDSRKAPSQESLELEQIRNLFESMPEVLADSQKIDYLLSFARYEILKSSPTASIPQAILFLFYISLIFLLLASSISFLLKIPGWRFILFTEKSKREKKMKMKRYKQLELFSVSGILLTIFLSIFANYIFGFLTGSL